MGFLICACLLQLLFLGSSPAAGEPYVERVVLVYHNLGELSEKYYPLPGYTYLSPILGLLVYDAANLSAAGLSELSIVASGSPISVSFSNVRAVPPGSPAPQCVWFDLDGVPQFRGLEANNVCATYRRGHFSIVVNSSEVAPAPGPSGAIAPPIPTNGGRDKGSSDAWKIAVGVVGGVIALGLLALLLVCFVRYKREKKMEVMERNAEVGETLRMAQVGRSQAPVALGTRTKPVIESEIQATAAMLYDDALRCGIVHRRHVPCWVHLQASNGEEIFVMPDLESFDYFFIVVFRRKMGLAIRLRLAMGLSSVSRTLTIDKNPKRQHPCLGEGRGQGQLRTRKFGPIFPGNCLAVSLPMCEILARKLESFHVRLGVKRKNHISSAAIACSRSSISTADETADYHAMVSVVHPSMSIITALTSGEDWEDLKWLF
ncbi:hypothetical protein TRIUR3_33917 [Triticum urartu]|uniref:Uncharacterized protein n=1 Tax=Triticum urartu TaxID=4572 RepID=M7YLV8_TRIUA|nr:hypothetical protein TRIUR3_33917 [Triticum urartu]